MTWNICSLQSQVKGHLTVWNLTGNFGSLKSGIERSFAITWLSRPDSDWPPVPFGRWTLWGLHCHQQHSLVHPPTSQSHPSLTAPSDAWDVFHVLAHHPDYQHRGSPLTRVIQDGEGSLFPWDWRSDGHNAMATSLDLWTGESMHAASRYWFLQERVCYVL